MAGGSRIIAGIVSHEEKENMNRLDLPSRKVDVVMDTDAYNEIDDQYAIAYMFCSQNRMNIKAVYAAPFLNERVTDPREGMEKSYGEIGKILRLMGNEDFRKHVYRGSERFLPDEHTPVRSAAAEHLVRLAMEYTEEEPLYVIAIAALTDIASALLLCPEIACRIVVIWLGGKARQFDDASEFNLNKDVAAVRVVFGLCGDALVQLPCRGVVSEFLTTRYELEHWLAGKNPLCDYLVENTVCFHKDVSTKPWSKPIWDVTAVAWLLNTGERFMLDREENMPQVTYDMRYEYGKAQGKMKYVYYIFRDELFDDLFTKLSDEKNFRYVGD